MQLRSWLSGVFSLLIVFASQSAPHSQEVQKAIIDLTPIDIGPTGIDIKRPVFCWRLQGMSLGRPGSDYSGGDEALWI
jgi:hypothetical protein